MLVYMLIGIVYCLVNILIRKLEIEGDWAVVYVWLFLWPICFISLFIEKFKPKL